MKRVIFRTAAGLTLLILFLLARNGPLSAFAEESELFIICQPDSFVNVREHPKMRASVSGFLEFGQKVVSDGKKRNGFVHCIISNESGEGWVYGGYLVSDQPVIQQSRAQISGEGRVACRRAVNGQRRKWLHNGDAVTVYAYSEEWSVTDEGFIKMRYLEFEHE